MKYRKLIAQIMSFDSPARLATPANHAGFFIQCNNGDAIVLIPPDADEEYELSAESMKNSFNKMDSRRIFPILIFSWEEFQSLFILNILGNMMERKMVPEMWKSLRDKFPDSDFDSLYDSMQEIVSSSLPMPLRRHSEALSDVFAIMRRSIRDLDEATFGG